MDAVDASMISHATTLQKVEVAVAKKTLDAAKSQGDAAVALLAAAADLASGKGGGLDVRG